MTTKTYKKVKMKDELTNEEVDAIEITTIKTTIVPVSELKRKKIEIENILK